MKAIRRAIGRALRRNPYPLYAALRRLAPVMHDRLHDIWLLSDFDSVKRALNDHDSFSSHASPPGGKALDWLIFQDPPLHTRLRSIVMRAFTPKAIAGLEPRIVERADALLDAVVERGRMDLVTDFAEPLPLMVIADMIGVPNDETRLRSWSAAILGLGDTVLGGDAAARAVGNFRAATAEMAPYVSALLAERRMSPKDDLLTRLVEAEVDGQRLAESDILGFFQLLLLAGSETTTNLIANAMLSFLENPEELARVRSNPERLALAIEEVLRYRSPVQLVFRATTREVVIHRRTIPAGKLVLALIGAANRDQRQFAHADRFDADRPQNAHVGFGHGAHFCIGASLARLEARIALGRLLLRLNGMRLTDGKPWQPRAGLNVHGPSSLPMTFLV
jgi:cytochrome P450